MAEQITDAILRRHVALWTHEALGPLVENDTMSEPVTSMPRSRISVWQYTRLQRGASLLFSDVARPVRFLCTGVVAGLLQLGLLALLMHQKWNPISANVVASLLTTQLNFILSFLFTWHDRHPNAGNEAGFSAAVDRV